MSCGLEDRIGIYLQTRSNDDNPARRKKYSTQRQRTRPGDEWHVILDGESTGVSHFKQIYSSYPLNLPENASPFSIFFPC